MPRGKGAQYVLLIFSAYLSGRLKVSYCDRSLSDVSASVLKMFSLSNNVLNHRPKFKIISHPIIGFYLYHVTSAGQFSNWTTSGIKQHILTVDLTV